jgi:hypothetical protein
MYSLYDTWGFPCEFPHSEIFGSQTICVYPKLIAAYRVLRRLLMPRHSPCALCSLTYASCIINFVLLRWRRHSDAHWHQPIPLLIPSRLVLLVSNFALTCCIISGALLGHFRRCSAHWHKPTLLLAPQFLVLLASNFALVMIQQNHNFLLRLLNVSQLLALQRIVSYKVCFSLRIVLNTS